VPAASTSAWIIQDVFHPKAAAVSEHRRDYVKARSTYVPAGDRRLCETRGGMDWLEELVFDGEARGEHSRVNA
jgi:hypothetical protein